MDADGLNKDYVYPLKRAVFCHPCHSGNGSWSIVNKNVPEPFRIAYEIQQVIEGKAHPLKITKEPLAKILD